MIQFKHRFQGILSCCWAFIASLSFDSVSIGRALSALRRVVDYVVSATASPATPVKAEWRIIERMLSESLREKINVFGRKPRSTGALCSPLL